MSNPFSVLDEASSLNKTPNKKTAKKASGEKKKAPPKKEKPAVTAKPVEKKKPTPAPQKRTPKVLIKSEEAKVEAPTTTATTTTEPVEKTPENRNFDGPSGLKDYKRDKNKGYFNRKPGQPPKKGGKRLAQRDRSVNRSAKNKAPFRKDGQGGKYSWTGNQRYVKKKPQEMTDEEWEKELQADKQNQKVDERKGGRPKRKKLEKKEEEEKPTEKVEEKVEAKPEEKTDEKKKKGGDKKKKFDKKKKGKKFDKEGEKKEDEEEKKEEEEETDEDLGKLTFEEYEKSRKKPVSINDASSRKAREGVKVHAKQLEYVRPLKRDTGKFMKVSKKKKAPTTEEKKTDEKKVDDKKPEEKKTDEKPKTKKKKTKTLSTAEFFKGATVPKKNFKNRRGPKNPKGQGKKQNLDLKDNKNFPTLK